MTRKWIHSEWLSSFCESLASKSRLVITAVENNAPEIELKILSSITPMDTPEDKPTTFVRFVKIHEESTITYNIFKVHI